MISAAAAGLVFAAASVYLGWRKIPGRSRRRMEVQPGRCIAAETADAYYWHRWNAQWGRGVGCHSGSMTDDVEDTHLGAVRLAEARSSRNLRSGGRPTDPGLVSERGRGLMMTEGDGDCEGEEAIGICGRIHHRHFVVGHGGIGLDHSLKDDASLGLGRFFCCRHCCCHLDRMVLCRL